MPIDASIYSNLQPVAPIATPNPLALIQGAAQVQDIRAQVEQRKLAGEAARQKAIDDAQVRSVFAAHGGDVDAAIEDLYKVNPRAAGPIAEQVAKARKEQLDAAGKGIENQKNLLAHYQTIYGMVNDEASNQAIRPLFVKAFPVLDAVLPTEYGDGSGVQRIKEAVVSQKDKLDNQEKMITLLASGKPQEALNRALAGTTTPEEWDQVIAGAPAYGVPKAIVAQAGPYSPENVARAKARSITPDKQAEIDAQAAARAAKGPTEEEATNQYRAIQLKAQLGQPVTPEEAAWAKAYEKQKTLTTDTSASFAANRQAAAIGAQVAQQQRAQDFTQLQAARNDIKENVDKPYGIARSGAETLRDVVHAAQGGNKLAGSLQNLQATMADIKSQGLNRINMPEIASTAQTGTLWDHIQSYVGQKLEGQPVPPNIQQDMLDFADILDRAAYKKYTEGHAATNTLYQTKIPPTYAPPAAAAPPPGGGTGGQQVGDVVTVNGKRVRITAVTPDGKFRGVPVD